MSLGQRLPPLSEMDSSAFLLKLDVADGPVVAQLMKTEEESDSQHEFSWWGTFVFM